MNIKKLIKKEIEEVKGYNSTDWGFVFILLGIASVAVLFIFKDLL